MIDKMRDAEWTAYDHKDSLAPRWLEKRGVEGIPLHAGGKPSEDFYSLTWTWVTRTGDYTVHVVYDPRTGMGDMFLSLPKIGP